MRRVLALLVLLFMVFVPIALVAPSASAGHQGSEAVGVAASRGGDCVTDGEWHNVAVGDTQAEAQQVFGTQGYNDVGPHQDGQWEKKSRAYPPCNDPHGNYYITYRRIFDSGNTWKVWNLVDQALPCNPDC